MELKGIYCCRNFKYCWTDHNAAPSAVTWVAIIGSGIEFPLLHSSPKQHNETVDFSVLSLFPGSLNGTGVISERNLTDRKGGNLTDGAVDEERSLTQNIQVGEIVLCGNAKECRFTH